MKLNCCDVYVKKNEIGYTVSIELYHGPSMIDLYFQNMDSVADFFFNNDVFLFTSNDLEKEIIDKFDLFRNADF